MGPLLGENCSWGSLMTKEVFKVVLSTADVGDVHFLSPFPQGLVLVDGRFTRKETQMPRVEPDLGNTNPPNKTRVQ